MEYEGEASSPSVVAYLRALAREGGPDGDVVIEPELSYGFGLFSLRLALRGPRGRYVVPSLAAFAAALVAGSEVAYGPKLSFAHRIGAFAPESRELARFVGQVAASRAAAGGDGGRTRAGSASRGAGAEGAGHVLNLTEAEVVEFLDAVGEGCFTLKCTDGTARAVSEVSVQAGNPPAALRFVEEDGGYVLVRDEALIGAAAGERAYVLYDGAFYRCTPDFAEAAEFLREVYRSDDRELFIARRDAVAFASLVLPRLERAFEVQAPESLLAHRRRPCRLAFYFDRVGDTVEVGARAHYGSDEVVLATAPAEVPDASEQVRRGMVVVAGIADELPEGPLPLASRDGEREEAALALLRAYVPAGASLALTDEEAVGRLLFEGLARFQELGEVHTTPAFDRLLFARPPRLSIGLSLAGDLIAMDVAATDVPAEELGALLGSYRRRRRFHRLRSGAFVNLEQADFGQLEKLARDMGLPSDAFDNGPVEVPTYQAFYLDNELADAYREDGFIQFVEKFRTLRERVAVTGRPREEAAGEGAPTGGEDAPFALRPYQRVGVEWIGLLWDAGLGGILADEMGLGKTVQVIEALRRRREDARAGEPHLVICPASLVYNWKAEFEKFAPEMAVAVVAGTIAERAALRERARAGGGPEVLITSYDLLRQDAQAWEEAALDAVVLDEAHYIKNHATRTTRAVKRLQSRHRLALTGTPMENRLSELWSLFDFLMPGFLGPYQRFRERFDAAIIGGDGAAADRLRRLVAPFLLRRTKAEVAPELPQKTVVEVPVALEGEQRRLYDAAEQSLRERLAAQIRLSTSRKARYMTDHEREAAAPRVQVLAELTALRRIALDPALVFENYEGPAAKMEALLDIVVHGVGSGQQVLVYSQFTSFLARVAERLGGLGIPFFELTGATPKAERLRLAEAFNEGAAPVFLISLKAGGVGLNLTGATLVVHADPWWNDAAARQAADRAHRIGQDKPVTVYELVASGTIEERMRELARMKTELAAMVLGQGAPSADSAEEAVAALTAEELWELLGG